MLTFTINISTGGAAMTDERDVREALTNVKRALADGVTQGRVLDTNGNTVGSWLLVVEDDD